MSYNKFLEFITERENIRLKKEANEPKPWTQDIILQNYKFTNVKREHDTTTKKMKALYQSPIYKDYSDEAWLLNATIFRYFGTWEFAEAIGCLPNFAEHYIKGMAKDRMKNKQRVFTGAYVISSFGLKGEKVDVIVDNVLAPLWQAAPKIVKIIRETKSWEKTIEELKKVQGFGGSGFMCKEVILDTLFSPLWAGGLPIDFNTWCPVGPGAARGLNRLAGRALNAPVKFEQQLQEMFDIFCFVTLNMDANIFPEDLVLHDIQFQLCEFDKYERVRLKEGKPRSRYNGNS